MGAGSNETEMNNKSILLSCLQAKDNGLNPQINCRKAALSANASVTPIWNQTQEL